MTNAPKYEFRTAADGSQVFASNAEPGANRWWFIVAFMLAAVLVGAGVGAVLNGGGAKPGSGGGVMAERACKDYVKDRLKAPGTARFSAASHTGTGAAYTVRGLVDSENSFGASLRSTYTCTVVDQGSLGWHLQSIELS